MSDEQFSPEEQNFIRQLREARPQIDPAARNAIREHMIAEFRYVTATPPAPRPRLRLAPVLAAAAALAIVIFVIGQVVRPPTPLTEIPTPQTQIAIVPSDTIQPTYTAEPLSITPTVPLPSQTSTPVPATAMIPTTPAPSEMPIVPTTTQQITIVVEGPVSAINENVLIVYDLHVEVAPGHPILSLLEVGDFVRVEGEYPTGDAVVARIVSNLDDVTVVDGETATVNLEGPVESIDNNQIVVNGITVQLDADDPILDSLQVDDFVSVKGNFENDGTMIVLVVVNVTVINDVEVIEADCWYHADAMGMGHWHCDGMGMGMGMGGMGMGRQ